MKVTPDMFVGSVVLAVMLVGASILRSRVRKQLSDRRTTEKAFERDVFHVSWAMIAVAIVQFPLAAVPLSILAFSPKGDIAGYVFFGGMAAGWALLGAWLLRYLLSSSIQFEDHQLIFREGRRKSVLLYHELVSVDTSSWYIACTTRAGGSRVLIPMHFAGSAMILARLRHICEQRANQTSRDINARDLP